MEEIFNPSSPTKPEKANNFADQIKELIQLAVVEGHDKSTIEKTFCQQIAKYFGTEVRLLGEGKLEEASKDEEIEQLSIETLLIHEENKNFY